MLIEYHQAVGVSGLIQVNLLGTRLGLAPNGLLRNQRSLQAFFIARYSSMTHPAGH